MEKYSLTYEDAKKICVHYNNFNFYEKVYHIGQYKICTFSYFLCEYEYFVKPLPEEPHINAFDMRGVTFIFDTDGKLWKRFLMLPKFFNLNQVESTQYDKVKDKLISSIMVKEDGSLIAFILTPDMNLFAKTIAGIGNEQSVKAYDLLIKNSDNIKWIKAILELGYTPLFEYVSYDNRIVLNYRGSTLKFIGLRGNDSEEFIPAASIKEINIGLPDTIEIIKSENYTLDELIEKAKSEKEKEGWVIRFVDGQLIKIKTVWYCDTHYMRTENVFREDYIIRNYLTETLDDIVAQLDLEYDKDALSFIGYVKKSIDNYLKFIDVEVNYLYNNLFLEKYNGDFKEFGKNEHKNSFFGLFRFYSNKEEYNKRKINMILRETYKLENARTIIKKYEN